jgi:hypothetical protein
MRTVAGAGGDRRSGRRLRRAVLFATLAGLLAGCAGQSSGGPGGWYAAHGGTAPAGDRIYVCHAFGCARRTAVGLGPGDVRRLRAMLAGARTPAAERAAAARAVAWLERRVAPAVGSAGDVGGLDLWNAGRPGQMDCIDEATNTTSYLLVLAGHGLLRHHRVASPVARGFFLDGRYPHATAVLVERRSGEAYAIDSWPKANGALPDVMPLDTWFATWPAE